MSWNLFNHNFNVDPDCLNWACNALYEAGSVNADVYWPMTDPMVTPASTPWYHAGEPYGPYDNGGDGYRLYFNWSSVAPTSTREATVTYANFNFCDREDNTYTHLYERFATYAGVPTMDLYEGTTKVQPATPWLDHYWCSHVMRLASDTVTLDYFGKWAAYAGGSLEQQGNYNPRVSVAVDATNITFNFVGTTGSDNEVHAHDWDLDKPYVITTSIESIGGIVGGQWSFRDIVTMKASQPGGTTYQSDFDESASGSSGITSIINPNPEQGYVTLNRSGNHLYIMGLAYGKGNDAHAEIAEGLERNYEDTWVCPRDRP